MNVLLYFHFFFIKITIYTIISNYTLCDRLISSASKRSTGTGTKKPGTGNQDFLKNRERAGTANIIFQKRREHRERAGTRHRFPSISGAS